MPKKKTTKEVRPEIPETPEETAAVAAEEQPQAKSVTEETPLTETPPDGEQGMPADVPQTEALPEAETSAVEDAPQVEEPEIHGEEVPEDFGEPEPDKVEYDVENAPDFCGTSIEVLSVSAESSENTLRVTEEGEAPTAVSEEEPVRRSETAAMSEPEQNAGEDAPPSESAPRELSGRGAGLRAFYGLNLRELDRGLLPEQQQEWNAIYASFRGRSVMSGKIAGVDPRVFRIRDRKTGEIHSHTIWCAVVIPFRVPILIPETEMWARGEERPRYVLRNLGDADIDFVITDVDRERNFVVASRRLALAARRYYFSNQPALNRIGSRVKCSVLTVSLRRLLVTCYGYDVGLTQRELDYTAIPDLTEKFHRGDTFDCIVKEYDSRANHLVLSAKELKSNPYDGADFRHPLGCSRQAMISSKYAGGVFCNLVDGVTVMCNYSFQFEDGDFDMGDRVTVVIQRYDDEKKQVYGKIVAKC